MNEKEAKMKQTSSKHDCVSKYDRDIPAELLSLLNVQDVARILKLKPRGVYSLVEQRRIPFIRISNRVRFDRSDMLKWIRENRVPTSTEG